jgi:hypothetical protein
MRSFITCIIRMINSRRMRWVVHVARMCDCIQDVDEKARRKETAGKPRRMWVNNIKMDLREIEWDGMDWINTAEDRDQWRALVNTVLNLRVP